KQLPSSSPPIERPKIRGPMGRKSPTDFSLTSSLMKSEHPPCSGSSSGTVARLQTTRPMSCSPLRRTRPFVSASARIPLPRSRPRRFPTFLLQVPAGRPGRELVLPATHRGRIGRRLTALPPAEESCRRQHPVPKGVSPTVGSRKTSSNLSKLLLLLEGRIM